MAKKNKTSRQRATFARIVHIHFRLHTGRRATAASLGKELSVSDRTVKRDMEMMRSSFGAELNWDRHTQTYAYARPCVHLPLLQLTREEATALVLATRAFAAWRGGALGRALQSTIMKIGEISGGLLSVSSTAVDNRLITYTDTPETIAEQRWLSLLLDAGEHRRALSVGYRTPGATRATARILHPLHLAYLDHGWLLLAHDVRTDTTRRYLLTRIRSIKPTAATFEIPADFDLERELRHSMGRHSGKRLHRVHLRLDAFASRYLRDRKWHLSQRILRRGPRFTEITLQVNNLIDIEREVLRWGAHVEVLGPPRLRTIIRKQVTTLAKRYLRPPAARGAGA